MWTVCITSISHVLKLNGYGGPQAKVNGKSQCFKGWETLVKLYVLLCSSKSAFCLSTSPEAPCWRFPILATAMFEQAQHCSFGLKTFVCKDRQKVCTASYASLVYK